MTPQSDDRGGAGRLPSTRRTFIKRAGAAAAAVAAPGLLAACGSTTPSGGSTSGAAANLGPGGLALARLDHPVTLPIYADNKAIASGLKQETGPLQFYNWQQYINPDVVKAFEKKYGVKVQISTFDTIDEAIAKLASREVQYDVFVPEPVFMERLVVGKILQPLNLSYVPNLQKNVWPAFANPWYDQGSRYSVPYTVYTTGHRLACATSCLGSTRRRCRTRGARCGPRGRRSPARSGSSTISTRVSRWASSTTASPISTPRTRPS